MYNPQTSLHELNYADEPRKVPGAERSGPAAPSCATTSALGSFGATSGLPHRASAALLKKPKLLSDK